MNDLIRDIEFFKEVIIAFTEGASDEKRMMVQRIENRLAWLQDELDAFESIADEGLEDATQSRSQSKDANAEWRWHL